MVFVAVTTISAGVLSIRDNFWPMAVRGVPAVRLQGYVNTIHTFVMLCCVAVILVAAGRRWRAAGLGFWPLGTAASSASTK
jgi:hypothetical protein